MAGFLRTKRNTLLYLLLFTHVLTVSLSVLSVAPDDFASECIQFAEPGSFNNPNQRVLLDTQFYQSTTLLTLKGEDGLWASLDFDMTVGTGSSKVRKFDNLHEVDMCVVPLYAFVFVQWRDQSQSLSCLHGLLVCGYLEGEQNNWMITQYINISRTGVTELLLNATFSAGTISECNGLCTDFVRIRIFQTNEPDELGRNDTSNYGGNVASLENVIEQDPIQYLDLVQIPISGFSTGLYLAVVDVPPGACISVSRLALYYYVCPEQVVNLVKYPETISPSLNSDSGLLLEAKCVDNAVLSSSQRYLECSQRGQWEKHYIVCSCVQGHYFFSNSCKGK